MTLLFTESFDGVANGAGIVTKWGDGGDAGLTIASPDRHGTGSYASLGRSGTTSWARCYVGSQSTIIVGFALRQSFLRDGDILVLSSDSSIVRLALSADGRFVVKNNFTVLATSEPFQLLNWHYVEFKVTVDNAAGAYELRVDEQTVLSDTGVDTQSGSDNWVDLVRIGAFGADHYNHVDDLYVANTVGTYNNDFLGDVHIVAHLPNGAGNYAQWTPLSGDNYTNVDEPVHDGDTSYNHSLTAEQKDTFTLTDVPAGIGGTCKGVCVTLFARKEGAGDRSVRPMIRSDSRDDAGTEKHLGTEYEAYARDVWETDPATDEPFTLSGVNALEAGYELVS